MKTLIEMKAERADLDDTASAILSAAEDAQRALTADEQAKFDLCTSSISALNDQIKRREEYDKLREPMQAVSNRVSDSAPDPQAEGRTVLAREDRPFTVARQTASGNLRIEMPRPFGRLVAFKDTPSGHEAAYRSGMWIAANLYGNTKAKEWCRVNGVRAAMTEGVNTAGGNLVPDEMETSIIKLVNEYGLFRRSCRVTPMSSDVKNRPRRKGGITAYYTAESTAATESQSAWDNVQLVAKKLMVLTRMSSELSEDAIIDVADDTAQEIAMAFAYKEDTVGFTGTGLSTDGGIVGVLVKAIDAAHTKAKVAAASGHDTMAEIDADDVLSLMAAIPQYAKRGSAWYCSPSAQSMIIDAIKLAGGGNSMENITNGAGPQFMGYPVYTTDVMADTPATNYNGAVIMAFGNLSMAATLGLRRGISLAVDNSVYFTTDEIAIKGTMRHDINVHDLGSTTVKSPFCVLVGTT
jgi:HK97 family phage major capsid protein